MSDIERELREAFQRREPPPGFADRVMARIPHQMPQPKPRPIWRREWMAVAAAACVAVVGGGAYEQHRRQVEGERAKQELIYALTVATQSLEFTRNIITR